MNRPIVIAHRGGAALAPENTLPAFRQALALGSDGIEFDLQLDAEGRAVVRHDMLDPGESGAGLPGIEDVLDLVVAERPDALIVIDLKATPWEPGREESGKRLIDTALRRLEDYPRIDRIVLGSFDWTALQYAGQAAPQFRTAFHTMAMHWLDGLTPLQTGVRDRRDLLAHLEAWRQRQGPGYEARSSLDLMRGAGADIWSSHHRDLTGEAADRARDIGLGVWTWTVNTAEDLRRVLGLGVDAVTTDRPDLVLAELSQPSVEPM